VQGIEVHSCGFPRYPNPSLEVLFSSTDSEGGWVGVEQIGVAVSSSHWKVWYKWYELVCCAAGAAQRDLAVEDDLFRQGPPALQLTLRCCNHAISCKLTHTLNVEAVSKNTVCEDTKVSHYFWQNFNRIYEYPTSICSL
jgi:hypothetical protein